MTRNRQYKFLDMTMMPLDGQADMLDDGLIIADNFDESGLARNLSEDPRMLPFLAPQYPFKVQFAIMHLCLDGTMRVRLNLNEYELHRNTLMIVTPGSIGECLEISPDCRMIVIAISSNYPIPETNADSAVVVRRFLAEHSVMQLTDAECTEIESICRAMRKKFRQAGARYRREILNGYLQVLYYNICLLMEARMDRFSTGHGSRRKQIFDHFIREIRQHYTTERSIAFYAERLCLTPKYLSQEVYAVSGRYAGDWIRDYVILEAKALLKSPQYSVQQISDMLNFPNQSSFGVYFKRAVGCSPSAYRRQ